MKIFVTLLTTLVITILFFVPDFVLNLLHPSFNKSLSFPLFSSVFIFSLLLVMVRSLKWQALILIILCLLQSVASLYVSYFGSEIMPEMIHKFFDDPLEDASEIAIVFFSSFSKLHLMLLMVIASYMTMALILYKSRTYTLKMRGASLIAILILLILPMRAGLHSAVYLFYPDPIKPSLYNVINSISLYVRQLGTTTRHKKDFVPYEVTFQTPKAQNIILIMGESTRADYMSLFGFKEATTPLLDMRRDDPNFIYKQAFSSAVSTATSLQVFFNFMLEPGNFDMVVSKKVNLFKLAKAQGYKTILISAQSSSLLFGVGTEYIDHFISRESIDNAHFQQKRDLVLLDLLSNLPLSLEKNFIVLHMRSQHAPYEDNYLHMPDLALHKEDRLLAADADEANRLKYASAMRFNDLVINSVIDYAQRTFASGGESYVFYTSDHAELLGEDGLQGHNQLHLTCTKVPFLVYAVGGDRPFMQYIQNSSGLTHYDIAHLIANRIGVSIYNPNIVNSRRRYVHGLNIMNPYNYLQFELDDNHQPINIIKACTD